MKQTPPHKSINKRGFTLVEVATVIAIIALLAGLTYPVIIGMLNKSKRAESLNDIKQIALAFTQYRSGNQGKNLPLKISRNPGTGEQGSFTISEAYHVAYELAWTDYLTEASTYQISSDLHVEQNGSNPLSVIERSSSTSPWILSPSFDNEPVSFDLIIGLSSNAPSSTPVAITRGLDLETGQWNSDETISPYGDDGGHVAFLDGHVEWFNSIKGQLTSPVTRKPVDSILQSVTTGARFFGDPEKSTLNGKTATSDS